MTVCCASEDYARARRRTDFVGQTTRYKIGESFLHLPQPRAMKRLEKDQAVLSAQVLDLSAGAEQCEKEMKELKVTLYARFGRAINLDE
jgi:prefoldin subunit 4